MNDSKENKMRNPILKIKNFGPIGENPDKYFEDGEETLGFFRVEFAPVTVLIGPQASGKSTILKLYSTFLWIEKALVQGKIWDLPNIGIISLPDIYADHIEGTAVRSSLDKYLNYQNMQSYIREDFKIKYCGTMYDIEVELLNDRLKIQFSIHFNYNYYCPKIMYVPSERNLLTVNEKNADKLFELSGAVKTFQERYGLAWKELSKENISLPIKSLSARYDEKKQTVFIINKNQTETPISEASSGCQSVVPVVVVSKYLTDKTKTFDFKKSVRDSSVFIRKIVEKRSTKDEYEIFAGLTKVLDEKEFAKEIKNIREKFSYLFNRCFINIVEEPEQNLFPETQADLLYELLACKNANEHNKLIFSTHSPYLLTSLNNAIYAEEVYQKTDEEIPEFPKEKRIAYENVSAYKCEKGGVFPIKDEETHLINADAIDDCSIKASEDFDKLQDLEAEYEKNKN